jgi:hypothetical protein
VSHKNLILLDIEQTLTTDVFDGADLLPENIRNIQALEIFEGASLGLMSWAIHDWTDSEVELFNDIRPHIETETTRFDDRFLWSMCEWVHQLLKHDGVAVSRDEVVHIFRKEDIVFKLRKFWQTTEFEHIFLIDDAIDDHLNVCLNDGTMITFLNIKEM